MSDSNAATDAAAPPRTPNELEAALREILETRYHDHHPFNQRMHEGLLSREEIQIWVRNRYYYQTRIPIKDGLILAKSPSAEFRRDWVQRIHDHDGRAPGEGGLELWLQLGEAVGLSRSELESLAFVVPGAKRACDAYVELVASHDLLTSVASSLTELAAGDIMHVRIAAFEKHYAWVEPRGLAYFRSRTLQAPRDARGGLAYVLAHASTREDQDRCLRALTRKCEILWSLLDAVERAGARPVLARAAERRFDEREGKAIVVLPERLIKLDGSSAAILDRCDGSRSANAVAMELAAQHPATPHVFEDVCDFIEQMEKLGVLTRASG